MTPSSRRLVFGLASLLALGGTAAGAGPAYLVRDLETSTADGGAFPEELVVWRDRAYFTAFDLLHGREMWTTDGTRPGTRVVRDVRAGTASSWIGLLEPGDERIWMMLDDGVSGLELWSSDGTAAGTSLAVDLCPGPCSTYLQGLLFAWRDSVFFTPRNEELGYEPWVSDGTRGGTRLLQDICPGPCSSGASGLARLGDVALFTASDPVHGVELWRTDGTPQGTALVKDICPGACSSDVLFPAVVAGGEAFFAARDDRHGAELWKSDGTTTGTVLVKDICPGACSGRPRPFAFGDEILLNVQDRFIWKSDGTPDGTVQVAFIPDVHLGPELHPFVRADGTPAAYFFTRYPDGNGGQLWLTDGTAEGTGPFVELEAFQDEAAVAGERLIFLGGPDPAYEIWGSDGTAAGTRRLAELPLGPQGSPPESLRSFGAKVVFTAETRLGTELWITDGTARGTRIVRDVNGPDSSSRPRELTAAAGRLFFAADAAGRQGGLWTSDGTADGTALLDGTARYEELTADGDRLFFVSSSAGTLPQPGVTDGTPQGTRLLWDSTRRSSAAYGLVTSGGVLYFGELATGGPGQRLWRSDGTPAGTVIVKDLDPDYFVSPCALVCIPHCCLPRVDYPGELTPAAAGLYLVGNDAEHGAELWKSDGSEAGTERVADLFPGTESSSPAELTPLGDLLYFTAVADLGAGRRLWRTDGTAPGTVEVATAGEPRELAALGGRLFFVAEVNSTDRLYVTEAGAATAGVVKVLRAGGTPAYAGGVTAVGERLFFAVFSEASGQELWTSDGTAGGTHMVRKIARRRQGSSPQSFAAIDGRLFFAADDGTRGLEPWTSDGTRKGTCRIADVAPGRRPSSPAELQPVGGLVFFAANDGAAGRELWAVPRDETLCRR